MWELSPAVLTPVLLLPGWGLSVGRTGVPTREGGESPQMGPQISDVLMKHREGHPGSISWREVQGPCPPGGCSLLLVYSSQRWGVLRTPQWRNGCVSKTPKIELHGYSQFLQGKCT